MLRKLTFILVWLSVTISYSQKTNHYKNIFIDAEYFILFEEYNEALPLYIEIFSVQPNNMNIGYRIGECYLHIPNEKKQAISYLEAATKEINENYRTGYFTETKAPKEAWLSLGNAYRVNNEFDKALNAFNKYKSLLTEMELDKKSEVNFQIQVIDNAKELMKNPINLKITNLGRNVNSTFANYRPVVSQNDSIMLFTSQLRFYDGVFFSTYSNDVWQIALNITPFIGSDGNMQTSSVSPDGKTLFLRVWEWDNYNIFISHYINNAWTKAEKFERKINTRFNETHACITSDSKTIYFASDKEGGYGGKDIYYITLDSAGQWTDPINIGADINTPRNEDIPLITQDGKLFFSSEGHYNMGGYDIFFSTNENKKWSKPINLGYPLNTTDDDLFFMPIRNGKAGYCSMFRSEGIGDLDIYLVEF